MYTEALEKELRGIKWKDFNELQTNKVDNINIETENGLAKLVMKNIKS